MATIKSITVSLSRKVSDGNYGSVDATVYESLELEADEDEGPVYRDARTRLHKQLRLALKEFNLPAEKPKAKS